MARTKTEWIRVSRQEPCGVCERPDWCTRAADGTAACCMRVESGTSAKNGGWIHRLTEPLPPMPPPKPKSFADDKEQDLLWRPVVERMLRCHLGRINELAKTLGVSRASLDSLHVGYGELAGTWCWSFPEWSPAGMCLGVTRRLAEPWGGVNKKTAPGSRRGLVYADGWEGYDGPVFVVEGGSDTAAGLTLGLCVIGRPSNMGGVEHLAEMLRGIDKTVVIVGERDRKAHADLPAVIQKKHRASCRGCAKCWPGNHGARVTARRLGRVLKRRVLSRLLPDGAKDLRAWLNAQSVDVDDAGACLALGRELVAEVGI